jgi:CheY-like chemotaxis protein
MKILIADDNLPLHDTMRQMLRLMGYDSITAATGEECLSKAASEKPDLILLDISLPDMDGREVARKLRSDPATEEIPILAFTAVFDPSFGKSCIQAGCDDYVLKPLTHEVLQEKLQALLGSPKR